MSNEYEIIKEKSTDLKNEVTEFIKENPLIAIAIAAGLGYLIAKLLNGKKE